MISARASRSANARIKVRTVSAKAAPARKAKRVMGRSGMSSPSLECTWQRIPQKSEKQSLLASEKFCDQITKHCLIQKRSGMEVQSA